MSREPMAPAKRQTKKTDAQSVRGGRRKEHSMLAGREPSDVKERQARKIGELADTLIVAGFVSLDDQAKALGLSRSTTWTILKARHKNYGLSATLIKRVLANPKLNPCIRAKLVEYVREKAIGSFGHNGTQQRRFIRLLAGVTTADVHALERVKAADVHALEHVKVDVRRTRRASD